MNHATTTQRNKTSLRDSRVDEEDNERDTAQGAYDPHPNGKIISLKPPAYELVDIWKPDIVTLAFVRREENIMHDEDAELVDSHLDMNPDGDYFEGFVLILKATNPVARLWVKRSFQSLKNFGCVFMALRKPDNTGYDLATNDAVLQNAIRDPEKAALLSKELQERLHEMVENGYAIEQERDVSKISSTVQVFKGIRLNYNAFYSSESPYFRFLHLPSDAQDQHFAMYLKNHEGNAEEVAVPISFWNRTVRAYKTATL